MPLAALILGESDALDGPSPASLPVAGQTLIEYQVRLAWHAGARHVVVMVDHVRPEMVAAFDRLRDGNIAVQIARSAGDAADRIHPEERLMLIAAGAFAPPSVVEALVAGESSMLLTQAEQSGGFERIDGADFWAGFAVVEGRDLRAVAQMLGEWDLGSTLLRAAIQRGCQRMRAETGLGVRRIGSHADAAAAAHSLASIGAGVVVSPFARFVRRPLAQTVATRAMAAGVPFEMASVVAPTLLAMAVTLGALGWVGTAFLILLIALVVGEAGARIGSAAMRRSGLVDWLPHLEIGASIALLIATARGAIDAGLGWGAGVLALWVSANLIENRKALQTYLGELAIIMGIAVAAGQPLAGFGILLIAQLAVRWWRPRTSSAMASGDAVATQDLHAF
jgi:hypothetical protein